VFVIGIARQRGCQHEHVGAGSCQRCRVLRHFIQGACLWIMKDCREKACDQSEAMAVEHLHAFPGILRKESGRPELGRFKTHRLHFR
jgi:hypothetical protein